jgi:hypothetical protein
MSEINAPVPKSIDPAELWDDLDAATRERVIEMFVGMAFRLVTNHADSRESKRTPSENPTER